MIPFRDENPTLKTPVVTYAIVALNVLVWVAVQGAGLGYPLAKSVCELGLIPGELTGRVAAGTTVAMGPGLVCEMDAGRGYFHVLSSMFLHGSWMHIIMNMWFFWIFGNNVEDSMGRLRFVGFYLMCGVAAALAQVAMDPSSPVPVVGASGAISGVMGAYLILYPRVRVYTLVPLGFFLTTIALPAWAMLGYWIVLQALNALPELAGVHGNGGVAFWAHIGGFVVGAAAIRLFANSAYLESRKQNPWAPQRLRWG
ncbi:MAG TPA: rhomboid family intramembrane serine protease [Candidatus Methylomirabilis sp.]|nr:rhomboid family intramembrane serine protease [Candidatus Methylomirabilis sp.]